mgnify:FL=1
MGKVIKESEFLLKLQELLELEQPIKMEDEFRAFQQWDSLAYLSVVAFIDEEYNIVISHDVFREFQTIADIFQYINKNNS